jgi:predicted enzyme related to lactoylglutathione lyase
MRAMAKNPFQHVDLRVRDHDEAWDFYAKILPPLGFTTPQRGKTFSGFDAEGPRPSRAWFGFTADPDHRPNGTRIAFWAESRERVDEIAAILKEAGALELSGPKEMPEYSPSYYAVFFADPSGNRLEVCYLED